VVPLRVLRPAVAQGPVQALLVRLRAQARQAALLWQAA
jgi:hypothetical protein